MLRRAPLTSLDAVEDLIALERSDYLAVSSGWAFAGAGTHLQWAALGGVASQDRDLGAWVDDIQVADGAAYVVVSRSEERPGAAYMPNYWERVPEGSGVVHLDPRDGTSAWFVEATVVSALVLTPSGAIVARRVPRWPSDLPAVDSAGCTEIVQLDSGGRPEKVLWRDARDLAALAIDGQDLYWARAATHRPGILETNLDGEVYSMHLDP